MKAMAARKRVCAPVLEGATTLSFLTKQEADLFDSDKNTQDPTPRTDDQERADTNPQAQGEGARDGPDRTWKGPLSGVEFASRLEGEALLLTFTIEGRNPICIYNQMITRKVLDHHADRFDFALHVSMNDAVPDTEILENMMGLCWASSFLTDTYRHLDSSLKQNVSTMANTAENHETVRNTRISIDRIKTLSDRIEARLEACAPEGRIAAIRNTGFSTQVH
jgi:hypothetical protein